jgi:hypothetical protein
MFGIQLPVAICTQSSLLGCRAQANQTILEFPCAKRSHSGNGSVRPASCSAIASLAISLIFSLALRGALGMLISVCAPLASVSGKFTTPVTEASFSCVVALFNGFEVLIGLFVERWRNHSTHVLKRSLHVLDNFVAKLGALDFGGAFHEAGEVVGDGFGADGTFDAFQD